MALYWFRMSERWARVPEPSVPVNAPVVGCSIEIDVGTRRQERGKWHQGKSLQLPRGLAGRSAAVRVASGVMQCGVVCGAWCGVVSAGSVAARARTRSTTTKGSRGHPLFSSRALCKQKVAGSCTCCETKTQKLLKQRIECNDAGRGGGSGEAVVNRRRWQRVPSLLEQGY